MGDLIGFTVTTFCAVFFVVDPFVAVPLYLSMTSGDSPAQRRSTALKAALTVAGVLLTFAVAGGAIFRLFGISIGAFRVAGGLLLFLMAVDMMRAQRSGTRTSEAELSEGAVQSESGIVPRADSERVASTRRKTQHARPSRSTMIVAERWSTS